MKEMNRKSRSALHNALKELENDPSIVVTTQRAVHEVHTDGQFKEYKAGNVIEIRIKFKE